MTYELAERLNDAGFPLRKADKSKWDGQQVFFFQPHHGYYSPTLSELIEACGIDFGNLEYFPISSDSVGFRWKATGRGISEYGSTPEEPVAKLWLALQEA